MYKVNGGSPMGQISTPKSLFYIILLETNTPSLKKTFQNVVICLDMTSITYQDYISLGFSRFGHDSR